jgi:hypothetical protein
MYIRHNIIETAEHVVEKSKVDSNFLLVLKIKCTKFHQDRSKTVDLHTKYTNSQTFSFIYSVEIT